MIPIYQREAMWMSFDTAEPAALQIGIGKVCAISGDPWNETLTQMPQNYVALPDQPWLAAMGFVKRMYCRAESREGWTPMASEAIIDFTDQWWPQRAAEA